MGNGVGLDGALIVHHRALYLCNFCHLEGEHGGRLRVRGKAPDKLTWWIGRDPILIVEGRELLWAA